ncbi:SAM-dependent methyltransferase [Photobacterium sp. TY1-4]|uniref:SAM-dependent methyltransferase n=1 Tax=Photobacterium sp. TY1-4 TaxID=2899122 RepID=UPI0021C20A3C|nr:cyclopropane-fatty-acyl-phospholipid synthase family protein [Photobacterium sp. TY1-4]UXI04066.1 cyclopropane-fatty-acyl-phospholipid synthase family protein [Photobacterium sp. TY1-4]
MLKSESQPLVLNRSGRDAIARNVIFKGLAQLRGAGLTLVDELGESHFFGEYDAACQAKIIINHAGLYARLLSGGSIAAGEAYIDGWWDSPDLTAAIRVIARNLPVLEQLESKISWLTALRNHWLHFTRRNSKAAAKQNILAHYDLGNDFYRIFLDSNMLYSAAIYESEHTSLEDAQIHKMERLCRQLQLSPSDHLLEIGTGWGAFAIYAAKQYGCRVTTTTISEAQYAWAKQRIENEGLTGQITLLCSDYRDLSGQFDKIVSVEMVEAVGKEYLATYIQQCQSLLKPDGLLALQAITMVDQRFEQYSRGVDFIQKHIFPGGFLPSVTVLAQQMTAHSDFVIRDLKDIGMDYARTLADWHQNFDRNLDVVSGQGFDETFIRMWRFYFCYCEGGFLERSISTIQLLVSRPVWRE